MFGQNGGVRKKLSDMATTDLSSIDTGKILTEAMLASGLKARKEIAEKKAAKAAKKAAKTAKKVAKAEKKAAKAEKKATEAAEKQRKQETEDNVPLFGEAPVSSTTVVLEEASVQETEVPKTAMAAALLDAKSRKH